MTTWDCVPTLVQPQQSQSCTDMCQLCKAADWNVESVTDWSKQSVVTSALRKQLLAERNFSLITKPLTLLTGCKEAAAMANTSGLQQLEALVAASGT